MACGQLVFRNRAPFFHTPKNLRFLRGATCLREHEAKPVIVVPIVVPTCPGVVSVRSRIFVIPDLRPDRSRDHCLFILSDNDRKDDKGKGKDEGQRWMSLCLCRNLYPCLIEVYGVSARVKSLNQKS